MSENNKNQIKIDNNSFNEATFSLKYESEVLQKRKNNKYKVKLFCIDLQTGLLKISDIKIESHNITQFEEEKLNSNKNKIKIHKVKDIKKFITQPDKDIDSIIDQSERIKRLKRLTFQITLKNSKIKSFVAQDQNHFLNIIRVFMYEFKKLDIFQEKKFINQLKAEIKEEKSALNSLIINEQEEKMLSILLEKKEKEELKINKLRKQNLNEETNFYNRIPSINKNLEIDQLELATADAINFKNSSLIKNEITEASLKVFNASKIMEIDKVNIEYVETVLKDKEIKMQEKLVSNIYTNFEFKFQNSNENSNTFTYEINDEYRLSEKEISKHITPPYNLDKIIPDINRDLIYNDISYKDLETSNLFFDSNLNNKNEAKIKIIEKARNLQIEKDDNFSFKDDLNFKEKEKNTFEHFSNKYSNVKIKKSENSINNIDKLKKNDLMNKTLAQEKKNKLLELNSKNKDLSLNNNFISSDVFHEKNNMYKNINKSSINHEENITKNNDYSKLNFFVNSEYKSKSVNLDIANDNNLNLIKETNSVNKLNNFKTKNIKQETDKNIHYSKESLQEKACFNGVTHDLNLKYHDQNRMHIRAAKSNLNFIGIENLNLIVESKNKELQVNGDNIKQNNEQNKTIKTNQTFITSKEQLLSSIKDNKKIETRSKSNIITERNQNKNDTNISISYPLNIKSKEINKFQLIQENCDRITNCIGKSELLININNQAKILKNEEKNLLIYERDLLYRNQQKDINYNNLKDFNLEINTSNNNNKSKYKEKENLLNFEYYKPNIQISEKFSKSINTESFKLINKSNDKVDKKENTEKTGSKQLKDLNVSSMLVTNNDKNVETFFIKDKKCFKVTDKDFDVEYDKMHMHVNCTYKREDLTVLNDEHHQPFNKVQQKETLMKNDSVRSKTENIISLNNIKDKRYDEEIEIHTINKSLIKEISIINNGEFTSTSFEDQWNTSQYLMDSNL